MKERLIHLCGSQRDAAGTQGLEVLPCVSVEPQALESDCRVEHSFSQMAEPKAAHARNSKTTRPT